SGLESCSAFAERVVAETPSTLLAVRRILRRLARCRDLSLYHLPGGRLGWGRGYDAVLTSALPEQAACGRDNPLAGDGEGVGGRASRCVPRCAGQRLLSPWPPRRRPAPPCPRGLPLCRSSAKSRLCGGHCSAACGSAACLQPSPPRARPWPRSKGGAWCWLWP